MDLYYKQEITVGVLVMTAVVVFVGGLLWLTGRSLGGKGEATVMVRFESVSGLTVGDPIHISGVPVGRVGSVDLKGVGDVLVRLDVREQVRPHADATAAVKSLDFLGARFVEYDPGKSQEMLPKDAVIEGARETEFAATATAVGDRAAELLLTSQELLTSEVRPTLDAVQRALHVIARVGEGPLVSRAESTLAALQNVSRRLDTTLANPAIEKSISQMDDVAANMNEMAAGLATATQALGEILEKVNENNGTLGRMVNDTTLATDLHHVMDEMQLLLKDLRERPGRYMPRNFKVF